jgi:transposase
LSAVPATRLWLRSRGACRSSQALVEIAARPGLTSTAARMSPWRDLPAHFGKWNTAFERHRDRVKADVFKQLFDACSEEMRTWIVPWRCS